jgi:hypothetical protein
MRGKAINYDTASSPPGTAASSSTPASSAVKVLPGGPGIGYRGLGWEPKQGFAALAALGTGSPQPS